MKFSVGLSALFFGAFAAAAPTADEFRLSVSDSSIAELNNRHVIKQGDVLIVSRMDSQHGLNFKGTNGSLLIENGSPIYAGADGHLTFAKPTSNAVSSGFSFSGNTFEYNGGSFYACLEEQIPRYGDAPKVHAIYAEKSGASLGDNCVSITLNKGAI
ncbi:hypothetical protein N7541_008541 [Penicillium brevicompactum]|uniref:Uncharacterized protein n=1 Tax=Penicillium brevicompactum TaxID=5074 RepID=A0A9W9UNG8_PENBR|nr:hypothetical protein N7541_008541 [Penicillium brevicompactum]